MIIPINMEGVEAVIKAWLIDIEVYDLFFGITWMRQANCLQMFGERKITIKRNDQKIRTIPTQIYLIKLKLPVVEFEEEMEINEWITDDVC